MINTDAVKRDKRHVGTLLDEMNQDNIDPSLHVIIVMMASVACRRRQATG